MSDPVAWTSLAISVTVALFTIWHQIRTYRRVHRPHLTIHIRQVTMFGQEGGSGDPLDDMGPGLQFRLVNTGARAVVVSQVHTQVEGYRVVWLSQAYGWVNLRLGPGESQEWQERLEPHFRTVRDNEPGRSLHFRIRGVATTSENVTFVSRYLKVYHPTEPLNMCRLRLENWWMRVRATFRRKPEVLN